MGTYNNSYSVNEDEALWELHEIRHAIHMELKGRSLDEINKGARDYFESWKNDLQNPFQDRVSENSKK